MDINFDNVVEMIRAQLDKDLRDPYILKPHSHAVYTVWKEIDMKERPKSHDLDDWTRKNSQE